MRTAVSEAVASPYLWDLGEIYIYLERGSQMRPLDVAFNASELGNIISGPYFLLPRIATHSDKSYPLLVRRIVRVGALPFGYLSRNVDGDRVLEYRILE